MDIFKRIDRFFVEDLWSLDLRSSGRLKGFLIRLLRLLYVGFKEFSEGQLNLRAMSLVYTTILSLVPLLAVSFSVLKAFGVHNQMEPLLYNFLAPLGPKGTELTQRVIGFVENMKVGVLGSVGLGMLIYTVVSLIKKIEEAFNYIWRVKSPRSFARRFSDYMSVLLIGPVLVVSAIGLTASIMSTSIMQAIIEIEPFGSIFYYAGKILPYILICVAFTFIYMFVPNTRVNFRSALVGGIFGGVLWESTGWLFASFVVSSTKYAAIYSGFAIMILFIIWLYLSWLILLVGAEVAFYHQYPQLLTLSAEATILSNRLKERLALTVMFLIALHFFENRPPWNMNGLVAHLGIPVEPVSDTIDILKKNGLIVESSSEPPDYLPGKDLDVIKLKEIIRAVRTYGEKAIFVQKMDLPVPEVEEVMSDIETSVENALGERTLKDMILAHISNSCTS